LRLILVRTNIFSKGLGMRYYYSKSNFYSIFSDFYPQILLKSQIFKRYSLGVDHIDSCLFQPIAY